MRFKKFIPLAALVAGAVVGLGALAPNSGISKDNPVRKVQPLRTGKLPNGMTYYVQANPHPAKRAFIWLAVDAGSVHEDDDQKGFAHLLEHMAFNGTENFPENVLIDVIEKAGMAFGADLNAFTSFDETVYQLSIPTDDPTIFAQGMQIVDDWANGRILNDSNEVVAERGVVLGEWRTHQTVDTAFKRFQLENLARVFGEGSKYNERLPIGDPELLRNANPAELIRFYEDWYHPENMAIIVVGDFDADAVEADVKARFGVTPKKKNPRPFKRPEIIKQKKTEINFLRENINPTFQLQWPALPAAKNKEEAVRNDILEAIFFPHMQRTAVSMAKIERRPFIATEIGRGSRFARPVQPTYSIALLAQPDSLMYGTAVIIGELERMAQHGLPQADLDLAKAAILRRYEQYVDGSSAIPSRNLAAQYMNHFLKQEGVLMSPQEELEIAKKILPKITSKDLAAFAARWRSEPGRSVTVGIPKFSTLRFIEETTVTGMLDSIKRAKMTSETFLAAHSRATGGNASEGLAKALAAPGNITEKQSVAGTDAQVWKLSNGAKVVYKPLGANPDEVIIHAHSLGGHSLLPDSLYYSSGRLVANLMTASGGFGEVKREDLEKTVATTGVRGLTVNINAFDEEIIVRGSPRELDMMFQLMHHQFTDPTIDTIALAEWRRAGASSLTMSQADQMASRITGHRRLAPPQAVNVPFMNLEQAMRVYKDRFGDASDFTFYIVGAVTPEQIESLVEKYLANLPSDPNSEPEKPKDLKIRPPTGGNSQEGESPRLTADQAQLHLNFFGNLPGDDVDSLRATTRRLSTVSRVLSRRLLRKMREELSVTYSISAPVHYYAVPDPRYVIGLQLLTDPEVIDTSVKVIWEVIEGLQNDGPSVDELEIAHTIRQRGLENAMQNNVWWISTMIDAAHRGVPLEKALVPDMSPLSAEEIAEAAKAYLARNAYAQQVAKPTKKTLEEAKKAKEKDEVKPEDVKPDEVSKKN